MKKILFALLLGLGLAQVSPVVAGDKEGFIKRNKTAIIVAVSALSAGLFVGDMYLNKAEKQGMLSIDTLKNTYTKAGFDKLVAAANCLMPFVNPFAKDNKKKDMVIAGLIDTAILLALVEIGNSIILKRPSLAKSLVKTVFAKKAQTK